MAHEVSGRRLAACEVVCPRLGDPVVDAAEVCHAVFVDRDGRGQEARWGLCADPVP